MNESGESVVESKIDVKTAWERYVAEVPSDEKAVSKAAFHLIRQGRIPSISEISEVLDFSEGQCRSLLEAMSSKGSVTIDEDRITGAGGLTIVPTEHQIILEGIPLYCWCALDTLGIPSVLAEDATVICDDNQSDEFLRLRFEAGRLVDFPRPLLLQLAPPDRTRLLCGGT